MKKLSLVLFFLAFAWALNSCQTTTDEDPLDVYREIAYNALSSTDKATVVGPWQDAEVGAWTDGNYLVTFQTTNTVLGPIRVVVDPEFGRVVEILPRP